MWGGGEEKEVPLSRQKVLKSGGKVNESYGGFGSDVQVMGRKEEEAPVLRGEGEVPFGKGARMICGGKEVDPMTRLLFGWEG